MATLNTSINIKKGDFSELPPVLPIESFVYTTGTKKIDEVDIKVAFVTKITITGTFRTSYTIPKYLVIDGENYLVIFKDTTFELGIIDTLAFQDTIYIDHYGYDYSITIPNQIKNLYINSLIFSKYTYYEAKIKLPPSLENLYIPENYSTAKVDRYLFNLVSSNLPNYFWNKYLKDKYIYFERSCFEKSNLYSKESVVVNEYLTLDECLEIKSTYIDSSAFKGITAKNIVIDCSSLNNNYLFKECYNLENVVIKNAVNTLGSEIFVDCKNLKNVYILQNENSLSQYSYNAFNGCSKLEHIYVPSNLVDDYKNKFSNLSSKISALPWEVTE